LLTPVSKTLRALSSNFLIQREKQQPDLIGVLIQEKLKDISMTNASVSESENTFNNIGAVTSLIKVIAIKEDINDFFLSVECQK
jgi:hypothetical protein